MKIFQNLLRKLQRGKSQKAGPLVEILELFPFDGPVYAVGDLHGCLSAYCELEALILKDAQHFDTTPTIILLGDIVDRGPQTAALIDHLIAREKAGLRVICLMGNHEEMMLDFLAKPETNMVWLDFGGLETLASYGIDTTNLIRMSERKLLQTLAAHIPQNHIDFLKKTLPGLQIGQFLLTHAGADREQSLKEQPLSALLWGNAGQIAPRDLILIHGHYVVEMPMISAQNCAIDTGAYLNGRLTCLRIHPRSQAAILTLTAGDAFVRLRDVEF